MDLTTTKQTDFKPFAFRDATAQPDIEQKRQGVKFTGKSMYEMAYPNWGPYEVIHMKHFNVPHHMDQLKLDSKTTYSDAFQQCAELSFSSPKTAQEVKRNANRNSLLSTTAEFYGETTAKRYYLDPRQNQIRTESMKAKEKPSMTEVTETHFRSLYQKDFEPTEMRHLQIRPKKLAEIR